MDKKLIVLIGAGVLVLLGFVYIFAIWDPTKISVDTKPSPTPTFIVKKPSPEPTKASQENIPTKKVVAIDSEEFSSASFVKVEDGNLYYKEKGKTVSLPFTKETVSITCTNQDLRGATDLDFNQVESVHPVPVTLINDYVPEGEPIVVFTAEVDGVAKAYTIAIKTAACSKAGLD